MMDTDQDGNVFVLGDTAVGNYLEIKKFNPSGTLLWETTYNPVDRLVGTWVAVDGNGDAIILASMVSGSNNTPAGWLTLKYDPDGNLLWLIRYRDPSIMLVGWKWMPVITSMSLGVCS